jgi:phosphoribosylamine--glycine ligase
MRALVVGGGAREHALTWKLAGEGAVGEVVCAPGNGGIAGVARCLKVDATDPVALADLAIRERIDLTVVGPEAPLDRGVANLFAARGLLLFGPTRAAAQLECSKVFAKQFMARHGVPTARFAVCETPDAALALLARGEFGVPVVIKADGLAAGKGVVVAADRASAEAAVRAAMVDRRFGDAGARLVIEECLQGSEASFFAICDGQRALPLPSAQDHKRAFDDDRGPNTGGMGAFAPSPLVTPALQRDILARIVEPVLRGLRAEGHEYRGFLYVGLMLTADGPQVIEFNVRFGDPEAQVVFPMIDSDLAPLLAAAARGDLSGWSCTFRSEPHVGVVLASGGYPGDYQTGKPIAGLDEAGRLADVMIFHAGTKQQDGRLVTSGGRVLTVVGRGRDFAAAIARAYDAVSRISFKGMHCRKDIGKKALTGRT